MIVILLCLTVVTISAGLMEYWIHKKNLYSIPVRIHVNGTRGKSSVARLIAAGLREGGIRTFAKTTGSLPKMITEDGTEYPVFRQSKPNILEQIRIVSFAAANKAEVLVIECMALQPYLQSLCEFKLIRATHGVITNIREDHLDVMGPSEKDVALALLGTTPVRSMLFTAESDYLEACEEICRERETELVALSEQDYEQLSQEAMDAFTYMEHKDNVALALKVCIQLGVERDVALRGMQKTLPDIGAMNNYALNFFGRNLVFVNGFAANDPESTEKIWNMTREKYRHIKETILVINCRDDRPDRSRQFGEAIVHWQKADKYVLIGSGSHFLVKHAVRHGLNPRVFINAENVSTENIFEEIVSHCGTTTLIMGIGNIAGPGLDLLKFFKNRAEIQS